MNGKELKVAEYNLTFGKNARMINVFGIFKYKANNNLYIIYADVNTTYNVVRYGSSHLKDKTALSMQTNREKDLEIVKEYIFKVINKESLDDFEIIKLDNIEEVEIIGSNMLEIKKEVLQSLIDLTIPKREIKEDVDKEHNKKNKKGCSVKFLLCFVVILVILGGGYYYFMIASRDLDVFKRIICTKTYSHDELEDVNVDEERTFNFNNRDILESVDVNKLYNFSDEDSYLDFINRGLYYKYMPSDDDSEGGWSKDDSLHTFKTIEKERVDTSYNKPTNYENVFSYYKDEGYNCSEKIEE